MSLINIYGGEVLGAIPETHKEWLLCLSDLVRASLPRLILNNRVPQSDLFFFILASLALRMPTLLAGYYPLLLVSCVVYVHETSINLRSLLGGQ